jgi:hypothetical protein
VQLGELTRRMALLLQVLSPVIGEQAFNELRTKQQLGYIASGNFRISSNIGTLVVLVQSTVVAPDEVQKRIETFLFEHMPTVLQVTDAVWVDWLIAANAAVQAQPQSALERAAHWWSEISTRDYDFDGAKRDSNILQVAQEGGGGVALEYLRARRAPSPRDGAALARGGALAAAVEHHDAERTGAERCHACHRVFRVPPPARHLPGAGADGGASGERGRHHRAGQWRQPDVEHCTFVDHVCRSVGLGDIGVRRVGHNVARRR